MKTKSKREVIARITGPGLVLAALLAPVLSSSVVGRAQSSVTSPAAPAATPVKASPASQAAQQPAARERKPGGNHEGITVHGHWTIEVRNPDGTLVTHREFENMLEQPTGAQTITELLGGAAVAGQLAVVLPVDCSSGDGQSWCIIYQSGGGTVGGMTLSTDVTPYFCPMCGGVGDVINCVQYPTSCLNTLAVSTNGGSLTLMGTVVAEAGGSVTAVQSAQAVCSQASTASACLAQPDATLQPLTGTPITPVPFDIKQSVSVTVTISFSSPS
jgi:hypothetical protein